MGDEVVLTDTGSNGAFVKIKGEQRLKLGATS